MWEPVGPLPASVYWRRRWIAVASTMLVVVVLVVTVAVAFSRPHDESTAVRNTGNVEASAPLQGSPPPAVPPLPGAVDPAAASTSPLPPGATPSVTPSPGPFAGAPSATGAPPSSGAASVSEQLPPDETPRGSTPPATPVQVPPAGPVPCTNEMLGVTAEVERPEHRVGERPALRLVVTNNGGQPCTRDLDPARQEVVVWSGDGAQRLWSSNDCSRAAHADLRTLEPGKPLVFSVRWAGRTSQPGCPESRTVVPAGSYRVMTRVDDVISAPTPFQRLP
jgi:hypothetical protein